MPRRRELIHFLDVDTRAPLCGGTGTQAAAAAVNGVDVCAACAKRVTEEVGRALDRGDASRPETVK